MFDPGKPSRVGVVVFFFRNCDMFSSRRDRQKKAKNQEVNNRMLTPNRIVNKSGKVSHSKKGSI